MPDKPDKPEKQVQMQPQAQAQGQEANTDAVAMLKADHRRVEELFANFESARTRAQKAQIATSICTELKIHSELEEKIFYPAVREMAEADEKLDEAQVEHDTVKVLVRDIEAEKPEAPFYEAKVTVLREYVKHHVGEEEAPDGILAQAQKGGIDLNALGQTMAQRKQELLADPKQLRPQPISLRLATSAKEKSAMPNNGMRGGGRGRDDQGRFTSSRDYDDDRGRRSSSRYDDDDDRGGGRGRGQGGWFGDPEGHSEASRRGWDEREGGGGRGGGGGSRGGGGGRGQGGWFGDPEGHSEASRRGWDEREGGGRSSSRGYDDDRGGRRSSSRYDDDDDRGGGGRGRGQGGWFGDPEGHSEAARRGWDEREGGGGRSGGRSGSSGGSRGYNDDDRGRRSRSSRDDDDDGGRGRGQGGWFGDSRGHSEAARRGWEDRR